MEKPDAQNINSTAPQNSVQPPLRTEALADASQASSTPMSNELQPDKNVAVPKYACCMASDPTINDEAINAILSRTAR